MASVQDADLSFGVEGNEFFDEVSVLGVAAANCLNETSGTQMLIPMEVVGMDVDCAIPNCRYQPREGVISSLSR